MTETKSATLTVLGGPLAGTRCVLPESGTLTLGSAPGSGLRLDLETVSPYHARIVVDAGRVMAHDTGAARALHVNDNPLEPGGTVLRNGDILAWAAGRGRRGDAAVHPAAPACRGPAPDTVRAEPARRRHPRLRSDYGPTEGRRLLAVRAARRGRARA
jgi:hypothetical protein